MSQDGIPRNWAADLPRKALVGAILVAFALLGLVLGGIAMWLLVTIASMFMMAEWADLVKASPEHKRIALFSIVVPLAILSPWAAGPDPFALGLVGGAAFFATIVTRQPKLGIGIAYVGVPAFALVLVRALPDGMLFAFWALATVWATDIGAYFAGRLIGGPKLMPSVSPNKTWAGLGGGMAAALVGGLLFHAWGGLDLGLAIASPILAIIAQIGDLYESSIKRTAGVKDSGTVLPGHGGVLDRLDGVVTVAPVVALLLISGVVL